MWPDIKSGTPRVSQRFLFWNPPQKKMEMAQKIQMMAFLEWKKNTDLFWGSKNFTSVFGAGTRPWINKDQQQGPSLWRKLQVTPPSILQQTKNRKIGTSPKGKSESLPFASIFRGYVKFWGCKFIIKPRVFHPVEVYGLFQWSMRILGWASRLVRLDFGVAWANQVGHRPQNWGYFHLKEKVKQTSGSRI